MTDNCFCEIFHTENGYFDSNGNVMATNEDMRYRRGCYQEIKWDKDITIPNDVRRYRGIDLNFVGMRYGSKIRPPIEWEMKYLGIGLI